MWPHLVSMFHPNGHSLERHRRTKAYAEGWKSQEGKKPEDYVTWRRWRNLALFRQERWDLGILQLYCAWELPGVLVSIADPRDSNPWIYRDDSDVLIPGGAGKLQSNRHSRWFPFQWPKDRILRNMTQKKPKDCPQIEKLNSPMWFRAGVPNPGATDRYWSMAC